MGLFSDVGTLMKGAVADIQKAEAVGGERLSRGRGPGVALLADPEMWAGAGYQYKEKPQPASYSVLRHLARRDTVLASIILTRLRQVKAFSRIRTHEEAEKTNTTGFRVKLRSGAGERTTKTEQREDDLNRIIWRCGVEDLQSPAHRKDARPVRAERSFASFLWKFTQDRLTIDQACAEIQYNRRGELNQFYAVDGATIRIVDPAKRGKTDADFVQLYQNRVVAKFTTNELMFCPENVTTDINMNGYSVSETEIAIKKTMAHLGQSRPTQPVMAG